MLPVTMTTRHSKVNLERARVVSKSPVLRIHGTPLIFIQLRQNDGPVCEQNVLGRGEETIGFHNQVTVGSSYSFEGLVATTVTKGTDSSRKILLLVPTSNIHPCDAPTNIGSDIRIYQGTVTECVNRVLGIYEMCGNHRYRLYLTYHYDGRSSLPIVPHGTVVTIHNPHEMTLPDESDTGRGLKVLLCCLKSSISFETKSKCYKKEHSASYDKILLSLCVKLHPTLWSLEWLRCQALPTLFHKLVPDVVRLQEVLSILVKLLTTELTSRQEPILQCRERKLYEEFLSHDTACSFLQSQTENKMVPYVFPKMEELAGLIDQQHPAVPIQSLLNPGFRCDVVRASDIHPRMVLVAQLCVDEKNGSSHLADSTGTIPCILAEILPNPLRSAGKVDHTEHAEHDGKYARDADTGSCSSNGCHPQPCLDHLLRIDDFVIVREIEERTAESTCKTGLMPVDGSREALSDYADRGRKRKDDPSGSKVTLYVLFNLQDALCLRAADRVMAANDRRRRRKRASQDSMQDRAAVNTSCSRMIQIRCKRPLLANPSLQPLLPSRVNGPSFFCDVHILKTGSAENDLSRGHGPWTASEVASGVVGFQGDAVRWYPFLRDGQLYKLNDSDGELQNQEPSAITKLSSKAAARHFYIISSFSQLQSIKDSDVIDGHPLLGGNHSETCQPDRKRPWQQSALTSLSGMITKKVVSSSLKDEPLSSWQVGPNQDQRVVLEVRDSTSGSLVSVKMHSRSYGNQAGLIPGAWITLRNCQKERSGNPDQYKLGPLSMIQVDKVCTMSFREIASGLVIQGSTHKSIRQRSFLCHIIQKALVKKDPAQVYWIYAHVLFIKKLILRWLCDGCGRNDCQCPAISRQAGRLVTQILVAVEDGTGECLLWSDDARMMSAVFLPPPGEWQKMEDACCGPGKELIYLKWTETRQEELYDSEAASAMSNSHSASLLRSTLSRYCEHYCLQRPLWFKCREFRERSGDRSDSAPAHRSRGLVLCCSDASP